MGLASVRHAPSSASVQVSSHTGTALCSTRALCKHTRPSPSPPKLSELQKQRDGLQAARHAELTALRDRVRAAEEDNSRDLKQLKEKVRVGVELGRRTLTRRAHALHQLIVVASAAQREPGPDGLANTSRHP